MKEVFYAQSMMSFSARNPPSLPSFQSPPISLFGSSTQSISAAYMQFTPGGSRPFSSSLSSSSPFESSRPANSRQYMDERESVHHGGPPNCRHQQRAIPACPVPHLVSLLFLLFSLLLVCPALTSARQRRSPPNGELTLPQECYHRYANSDHHSSLLHWLHRKNASHYSPISPSYHQALLKLQAQELSHGVQVTSGASSCNTRKLKAISATTPLRERALCQFEYILNYNPQRIPSTFTEVKCSCQKPSVRMIGNRMFECEPLRYQVRVLLFDPQCLTYVEHTETIALACLPVLQANTNAEGESEEEIQVPAEPYASSVPT